MKPSALSHQPSARSCKPQATSYKRLEALGSPHQSRLISHASSVTPHQSRFGRGFTLVEVLVALAIVAVALLASLRAVGTMAHTAGELKLRLLAQVSAENRIAELRAARAFPGIGTRTVACPQGRVPLQCVEETKATPNPLFRRIEVRVYADSERDHVLAELVGILPNES